MCNYVDIFNFSHWYRAQLAARTSFQVSSFWRLKKENTKWKSVTNANAVWISCCVVPTNVWQMQKPFIGLVVLHVFQIFVFIHFGRAKKRSLFFFLLCALIRHLDYIFLLCIRSFFYTFNPLYSRNPNARRFRIGRCIPRNLLVCRLMGNITHIYTHTVSKKGPILSIAKFKRRRRRKKKDLFCTMRCALYAHCWFCVWISQIYFILKYIFYIFFSVYRSSKRERYEEWKEKSHEKLQKKKRTQNARCCVMCGLSACIGLVRRFSRNGINMTFMTDFMLAFWQRNKRLLWFYFILCFIFLFTSTYDDDEQWRVIRVVGYVPNDL